MRIILLPCYVSQISIFFPLGHTASQGSLWLNEYMTCWGFCCFYSVIRSCLTLWDPMNHSTPGLPVHNQLPKFTQTHVHWVMPSNHLILCHPLLFLPSTSPSIRVFSNEPAFCIRWPKYWRFSFSISPSNEYSGLVSFRIDWFDLLAVQGTLKSLLQHHSPKASILQHSAFFIVQLSHPYITTEKTLRAPLNFRVLPLDQQLAGLLEFFGTYWLEMVLYVTQLPDPKVIWFLAKLFHCEVCPLFGCFGFSIWKLAHLWISSNRFLLFWGEVVFSSHPAFPPSFPFYFWVTVIQHHSGCQGCHFSITTFTIPYGPNLFGYPFDLADL